MDFDVVIVLPFPPIGKQRPRVGKSRSTGKPIVFTSGKTRSAENWVGVLAAQRFPRGTKIDQPIRVDIAAISQRPLDLARGSPGLLWRHTLPDGDNVRKLILDGLKTILPNDARVVSGETLSLHTEIGGHARVVVRIRSEVGDAVQQAAALGVDSNIGPI